MRRSFRCVLFYLFIGLVSAPCRAPATLEEEPQGLDLSNLEFHSPTIGIPYFHFSVRIDLSEKSEVFLRRLTVNDEPVVSYRIFEKGLEPRPDRPNRTKRLAIWPAVHSSRPEKQYTQPVLVGRLDWQGEKEYRVRIEVFLGGGDGTNAVGEIEGKAPSSGGYWNVGWKHYQSVVLTETAGIERRNEPVEVTFLFYPDQIHDPTREIRVFRYDWKTRKPSKVPCQILDFNIVDREEEPRYNEKGERRPATFLPTGSATVLFPADVKAGSNSLYLVFYGYPKASTPELTTDLKVDGPRPGVVIENRFYILKLHDKNGMLDAVTLKSKPEYTFVHKKETNGAIQWNPGCYAPPRAWAHLSDWEPGKHDYEYEENLGPLVYKTRRWGLMPLMPELDCSMAYAFYAGVPFFKMRSVVHVKYDVPVQALRNAEVVFAREAFNEAAWRDPLSGQIETRSITQAPDLTEWVLPEDTPWIAFFDREKGCGYAGIQLNHTNFGLEGRLRTLNPYMYITTGPWIYWTRALLYPYGTRNPQQLVEVLADSLFYEEWAYLPFELSADPQNLFQQVERWNQALKHPLYVHVEDPTDPRMEVPEEIYLEPARTGWEE